MSMQYIRDSYGVPAKRGRLVEVYLSNGKLAFRGHIGSASNHIHVKSERGGHSLAFHPTDRVVYYDDDGETVLLDTRSPEVRQRLDQARRAAIDTEVRAARARALADARAAEARAWGKPVGWEAKRAGDDRWVAVGAGSKRGELAARLFAGDFGKVRPVYAGAEETVKA